VAVTEAPVGQRRPGGTERANRTRAGRTRRRIDVVPYLFLLPYFVFFGAFLLYPFVYGTYISLFDFDFAFPEYRPFVGLENYENLFVRGSVQFEMFWRTVGNTLTFVAYSVPPMVVLPVVLATLLDRKFRGRDVFRSIFFAPWALSVVVAATLWWWLFQDAGLVNVVLDRVGLPTVSWLGTTSAVANWTAITVATVWWTVGLNTTIVLAALQQVPTALYEAAAIDGATVWQRFRRVTLPLLRPALTFVVTIQIIASFNLFGQPLLMTTSNNLNTRSVIMYIVQEGVRSNRMGSAAAMSIVVAVLTILVTLLATRFLRTEAA
jgi:multiple sugar transport system permease protein